MPFFLEPEVAEKRPSLKNIGQLKGYNSETKEFTFYPKENNPLNKSEQIPLSKIKSIQIPKEYVLNIDTLQTGGGREQKERPDVTKREAPSLGNTTDALANNLSSRQ